MLTAACLATKRFHRRCDIHLPEQHWRGNAQMPAGLAHIGAHAGFGILYRGKDLPSVDEVAPSLLGERNAAGAAVEQAHPRCASSAAKARTTLGSEVSSESAAAVRLPPSAMATKCACV